jgi:hypothetical protein
MFEKSNLTPADGRSVAFGSYLSVISENLCLNAAPLQENEAILKAEMLVSSPAFQQTKLDLVQTQDWCDRNKRLQL